MIRRMPNLPELEALITRLATIDYSQGSEQATREMAVNPVIGGLGWDTFNPDEVAREFSVRGGRVDYCLRGRGKNLVLVEVKRAGTDLGEHQEQLLRYAFDEGVPLAALTDGLVWWLYLPMAGGSWEQRRFFRIDFHDQDALGAASALDRFLNRDASVTGAALGEAQREFESQERDRRVRAALEDAWQQVLGDPDGLLRDLLVETVEEISGHRPDPGTVAAFLQRVSGNGITGAGQAPPPQRHDAGKADRRPATPLDPEAPRSPRVARPSSAREAAPSRERAPRTSIAAYWLDGRRHEVAHGRAMIEELCNRLIEETGDQFDRLVAPLRTSNRFSSSPSGSAVMLRNGTYLDVTLSTANISDLARRVVRTVRGTDDGFRIELAD